MKEDKLKKINKELKVYINESAFISMKCRNKLLKLFAEEFQIDLDIDNYKNVDLSIEEDFRIFYREDYYSSREEMKDIKEVQERFESFKEKADKLISKKEISFKEKTKYNNIFNIVILFGMGLLSLAIIYLGVYAFIIGNYFDCFYLVIILVPWFFPKFKENFKNRLDQAKNYFKRK